MWKKYLIFLLMLMLGVYFAPSTEAQTTPLFTPAYGPNHLTWAQNLLSNVPLENNYYYSSGALISWSGYNGAASYYSVGTCAPFITMLLKHSYGITDSEMSAWMYSTSPNSERYYGTIVNQRGFIRITKASDIQPGDIIAIDYLDTTTVSGHTMLVASVAIPRTNTSPIIDRTNQWELAVIDQSSSYHGSFDTRATSGIYDGLGQGTIRLYTDRRGNITGYTWSTSTGSVYYDNTIRPLAVGRLNTSFTIP